MNPIRDRLEGLYYWFYNRLTGVRCYAEGCGRLLLLHTPRQWNRCLDTPLGVSLTVRGWLLAHGLDPPAVDAWCQANGVRPDAIVQPVVPVSHARSA